MHGLMRALFALGLVTLPSEYGLAQPDTWPPPWVHASRCTRQDADKAEYQAESLKSWVAVYRAFKRYGQCDDGAIAEGYSASVATLLADYWPAVRELSDLAKKDPMFQRFVFWHVDETMDMQQGNTILANARDRCPSGMEKLCKHLEAAVERTK